jgi:hypothetical protein
MEHLDPYLDQLRALRGVKGLRVSTVDSSSNEPSFNARISLRTTAGVLPLIAVESKSHLGHGGVEHLILRTRGVRDPVLVLAPHVGSGIGTRLADAGLNYLDLSGNCHIAVGSFHVHIEGRTRAAHQASDKGLRSAGFQVLFTYLADSALLDAPVRTVADRAGVSRQPVSDVRQRLLQDDFIVRARGRLQWSERRKDDALRLWLNGYETTVRPSLLFGTYRTRSDPDQLEQEIAAALPALGISELRWGGTSAGFRFTKYYRGSRTTVHVHAMPADLPRKLRALPDPHGNLVVMDAFGAINWQPDSDTVHPLLVYSEMLRSGDERARDAAEGVFDELIRPAWSTAA